MIFNYKMRWFKVGVEVKASPQPSAVHLTAVWRVYAQTMERK